MSRHRTLDGLKALITGSSSGIGRATAELLLRRGATVVGIARDHAKFAPDSDRYEPVTLDLSDLDAAAASLDDLARVHHDVAAVVSNAGAGRFGAIEQFSASQIRHDIDLNLTSHLLLARSFLPVLKRRKGGDLTTAATSRESRALPWTSRRCTRCGSTSCTLSGWRQSKRSREASLTTSTNPRPSYADSARPVGPGR